MNFSYENQGATTYLVCKLEKCEEIDALTLGMITNNHINGVASVLYTEMDGEKFVKFNVTAKITAEKFFSSMLNKQRLLLAFQNILNAITHEGIDKLLPLSH